VVVEGGDLDWVFWRRLVTSVFRGLVERLLRCNTGINNIFRGGASPREDSSCSLEGTIEKGRRKKEEGGVAYIYIFQFSSKPN